jgi:hypothetical protein
VCFGMREDFVLKKEKFCTKECSQNKEEEEG